MSELLLPGDDKVVIADVQQSHDFEKSYSQELWDGIVATTWQVAAVWEQYSGSLSAQWMVVGTEGAIQVLEQFIEGRGKKNWMYGR